MSGVTKADRMRGSKGWRLLALAAVIAVSGCTALNPFPTGPLPPTPQSKDAGPRVAICYNALKTSADKVREMAQAQCIGKAVVEKIDTDYHLDDCPLLTPARATFVCKPIK